MLDPNLTHHVILTYDGQQVRLYRNGTIEGSADREGEFSTWDAALRFVLGNDDAGTRPWRGELYRVAIYDRGVDSGQAANLFAGQPPGPAGQGGFRLRWIEP